MNKVGQSKTIEEITFICETVIVITHFFSDILKI